MNCSKSVRTRQNANCRRSPPQIPGRDVLKCTHFLRPLQPTVMDRYGLSAARRAAAGFDKSIGRIVRGERISSAFYSFLQFLSCAYCLISRNLLCSSASLSYPPSYPLSPLLGTTSAYHIHKTIRCMFYPLAHVITQPSGFNFMPNDTHSSCRARLTATRACNSSSSAQSV